MGTVVIVFKLFSLQSKFRMIVTHHDIFHACPCIFNIIVHYFRHLRGCYWCLPGWTFFGGLWKKWKPSPYLRSTKKNPSHQGMCVCVLNVHLIFRQFCYCPICLFSVLFSFSSNHACMDVDESLVSLSVLQALVEKPSSTDKKTYRYLITEEDKSSAGKPSI